MPRTIQETDLVDVQPAPQHFACIDAMTSEHALCSTAQAIRILNQVLDSSQKMIKDEQKRRREMNDEWLELAGDRAGASVDKADSIKTWQRIGGAASTLALVLPWGAPYFTPYFPTAERMATLGSDLLKNGGTQFAQEGSNIVQNIHDGTISEKDTEMTAAKMRVDEQQSLIQQLKSEDQTARERTLEVIRTIANSFFGR